MNSSAYFRNRADVNNAAFPTRDNTVAITVTDVAVQQAINEVNQEGTGRETYQRHQRALERFIAYIEVQYAQNKFHIQGGDLTNLIIPLDLDVLGRDKEDFVSAKCPKKYRQKDIVWHNLPVTLVKAYLSTDMMRYKHTKARVLKRTDDGRPLFNCRDYPSKFVCSIKFCNKMVGGEFSPKFLFEIGQYLHVSKRSYTKAKKEGQTEEHSADPIPWSLLYRICEYAVAGGLVLLWTMSLLQWNCIGRVKNIGELQLSNFTLHEDCIGVTYDDTKTKKDGEKLNVKHIYANVKQWFMNCLCALGIYFMYANMHWAEGQLLIFSNFTSKSESASSRYGTAMRAFVTKNIALVQNFMSPSNFNPYGLRKGPATHASSNTTSPPPIPSIFHRGEWSMGTVIDIYWRYAEAGDHYLGRILAGYNPSEKDFDSLPPHFTVGLDHPKVKRAMIMCFGNILSKSKEGVTPGLLFRCLASVVYHSDSIISFCTTIPGSHMFMTLPLFQDQAFITELKALVTIEKTDGICAVATGIPPNAQMQKTLEIIMGKMDVIQDGYNAVISDRKVLLEDYATKVNELLERRALENNQLTHQNVKLLLQDAITDMTDRVEDRVLGKIRVEIRAALGSVTDNASNSNVRTELTPLALLAPFHQSSVAKFRIYTHGSGQKYYFTPSADYNLPKRCQLRSALGFFLNGDRACRAMQLDGELGIAPVRPFCLWETHEYLPPLIWKRFKVGWKPILDAMMGLQAFQLAVQQVRDVSLQGERGVPRIYTFEELDALNMACISYLVDTKVTYVQQKNYVKWTVTTWSTNIQHCKIVDKGTAEDVRNLCAPTSYNKRRRRNNE